MSEAGPDTLDAGTVEVDVTSETKGFRKELEKKLEKATRGLDAKVGIDLRKAKTLRKELEAKIDEVAAGVKATIGIDVDPQHLRLDLQNAAKQAALGVVAEIGVRLNHKGLRAELEKVAAETSDGVEATIDADFADKDRSGRTLRDRLRDMLKRAAKDNDARVGVHIDKKDADQEVDDTLDRMEKRIEKRNIWQRLFQRRPGATGKDGDDGADGVDLGGGGGAAGGKGFLAKLAAGLDAISGGATKLLTVASLIGPAVAAIGQAGAGLLVMASNLAASAATLAVLPLLISGMVLALGTGIIAFSGLTGEIKDMPPAMREARLAFESLKDEWTALRDEVRQNFWKEWADQIKPIGEVVLPQLQEGLGKIATSLGTGALDLAKWLGSEQFKTDFAAITNALAGKDGKGGFLGQLRQALFGVDDAGKETGKSTRGLVGFLSDLMVATIPLQEEFGNLLVQFGEWAGGLLDSEPEREKFKEFLDYASDKGAQAGRIMKNIWDALAGIFRAGKPTGDSLLERFEQATEAFDTWVNGPGYQRIVDFFEAVEPAAAAAGDIFVELAKGLGKLMENEEVASLLQTIADDLVPSLVTMLTTLADSAGNDVIGAITEIVETITKLGQDGSGIGFVAEVVGDMFSSINDFLDAHPDATAQISAMVTALLGLSALKQLAGGDGLFSGMLGDIVGGGLSGLGNGKNNGGSGVGQTMKDRLTGSTQVFWNRSMPVHVTNASAIGGGGDTVVGGGDGDSKDKDKNKPGAKPRPGGTTVVGSGSGSNKDTKTTSSSSSKRTPKFGGKGGILGSIAAMIGLGALDSADTSGWGGNSDQIANGGLSGFGIGSMFGPWGMLAGTIIGTGTGVANAGVDNAMDRNATKEDQLATLNRMLGTHLLAGGSPIGLGLSFAQSLIPQETWDNTVASIGTGFDVIKQRAETGMTDFAGRVGTGAQTALTNLGVFKENADGTVTVDLAGPGKRVVESLSNAIPEPVKGALSNLGIFKENADGTVTVDLSNTGKKVADGLANALPTPVQNALTNLGVFKRDANGRVSVDLGGTGRTVVNGLANALPAPVQGALTNLGVFKRDANGRVSVDLKGAGSRVASSLRDALPAPVRGALENLGVFKKDAEGRVRVDLSGVGRNIISSLKRGMESMFTNVKNSLNYLTNMIPSWKGPEERDAELLTDAGVAIINSLKAGLESRYASVKASLQAFTGEISETGASWAGEAAVKLKLQTLAGEQNALLAETAFVARLEAMLAKQAALNTGAAPVPSTGGGTGEEQAGTYATDGASLNGVTFLPGSVTIHNPIAETASESISAVLRETAYFAT